MADKDIPQIGGIREMLNRIKSKITELESAQDTTALRAVSVDGNTVKFFTTTDTTTTAAYSFDFPEELFLDQTGTELVENFTFSALTYPNATDPNLEGKTVLVLAVKGNADTPTVKYSFVNLEKLIDSYIASDTSITIDSYKVKVNISSDTSNLLTLTPSGLMVDGSGKVDKVTGATAGNIAIFGSDGGIVDSTFKVATEAEFTAMLDEVFPVDSGGE